VTAGGPGAAAVFDVLGANAVLDGIPLPALLLKEAALENNISVMKQYAAEHGFVLAPHGKTTMAPKLFRRQLDAGAWAITVANMAQAAIAYEAGAQRVLVANEIVSRADALAAARALTANVPAARNTGASAPPAITASASTVPASHRQLFCLVDSVDGVDVLDRNLGLAGLPGRLGVLVELGVPGWRTGAWSEEGAVAVARAVASSERLRLIGVEGFEGLLASDRSAAALAKVDHYLEGLRRLTVRLADAGSFSTEEPVLVSAGGSRYFDRVAHVLGDPGSYGGLDVRLVVRSGCYLVHDHGTYADASPLAGPSQEGAHLVAALEVWADVLSVPEPGLVIVGLGRRDASFNLGLPVGLKIMRAKLGRVEPFGRGALSELNDQHGYLRLDGGAVDVEVGDRIGFGISHPCTAFDKWRTVLLVRDDYEILDRIDTFFH